MWCRTVMTALLSTILIGGKMSAFARKSSLIAAILALAAVAPADAQIAHWYAGLTGGATYSNIKDYSAINSDWRWGGTAGLMAGWVTSKFHFVELTPSWTQMGGGNVRLDYVDIPVMSGLLLPLGDRSTLLRAYMGLTLSFKVSCTADVAAVCDAAKGTFWAWPLGVSVVRVLGGGRFVGVDTRYAPFPIYHAFDGSDAVQRSWQFRALFGLPLGGR